MKIKQNLAILVSLCVLIGSGQASAQPARGRAQPDPSTLTQQQIAGVQVPDALYRLAAAYKQKGDVERLIWALQRLTALQPNVGNVRLALAAEYAQHGDQGKAYETLLGLQKQGYGYDIGADKNFESISHTKVWTYIVDNLKKALAPFGEGKVAFTLPKGDTLYEALAWDSKRGKLLVGSVRDGSVSIADAKGHLTGYIKPDASNGLWSVYAMAIDQDDDALYVASTSSVFFKGFSQADFGKAGVFKFQLSTGKFVEKYLLMPDQQPRTLSSIAVGNGGSVFAADGIRNIIYRLDGGALKPMVENPRLTSIRGLAVSGDGKTLYFADYAAGVLGADLGAGSGFDLHFNPTALALGGIDGLYWYDNTLITIQSGMTPHRIMRLHLGDDGHEIVKAMPIDSANAAMSFPTYGTIDGDALYFVANSQKNQYGQYGSPKDAAKLEAVKVFKSNLRFAWDQPGIDTQMPKPRRVGIPGITAPVLPPMTSNKPGDGVFKNVVGGASSVHDQ